MVPDAKKTTCPFHSVGLNWLDTTMILCGPFKTRIDVLSVETIDGTLKMFS